MIEAAVLGRVGVDFYPNELRTPLRSQRTFTRYVGGFAGNVATGLARLGVAAAIVSRVGDDGHGEFVRDFLAAEGVDVRFLAVDPSWLTPPTFVEVWPPDDFPITFYRRPTVPDWELSPDDFDAEEVAAAALLFVTGTALARSPSRETTLQAMRRHAGRTIFDLDWRPSLWERPEDYPAVVGDAIGAADIILGNEAEVEAAGGEDVLGAETVIVKRGAQGATVLRGGALVDVEGRRVDVLNGLGAGDAFAAALGHGLLRGLPLTEAVLRANVAGSLVVQQLPCSEAMPTLEQLESELA